MQTFWISGFCITCGLRDCCPNFRDFCPGFLRFFLKCRLWNNGAVRSDEKQFLLRTVEEFTVFTHISDQGWFENIF